MPSKGQMTGMQGVYLVAAELTGRGFIVSPTSRSARGADLLVTDQDCRKAWSVQVKTNRKPTSFWLVGQHALTTKSDSHVYVFVNLKKEARPEYLVATSNHVAGKTSIEPSSTGSVWYAFYRRDRQTDDEGWGIFGDPHVQEDAQQAAENSVEIQTEALPVER
jgi:hypothetical protein